MILVKFALWVLAGLLTGWLAGSVMRRGGDGRRADIVLGLVGSIIGTAIGWALGVTAGAGMVALTLVAFVGAVILIVAQRTIWPTIALRRVG
jgi:uncharacterized membrane protein YeaQ/YmgE (transglycosylase-associated protein family)